MLLAKKLKRCDKFPGISDRLALLFSTTTQSSEIERITRIINDHPFPDQPLHPTLLQHLPQTTPLSSTLVENVLGRLFAAHSNGLKALEFFKFTLQHPHFTPTPDAFEKTLHILARMRYFDQAWELMSHVQRTHPSLLTLKSMSIMLSRISKFQSYEETLEAFDRMEREIFVGIRKFCSEEFNVLLQAFCTQKEMKEARSVFVKLLSRFAPNNKTMNILLLGFKESGDVTAMEMFYHEMVLRRFRPSVVTYNIRIDGYCKKGCFGDAMRLFEEMERVACLPSLQTITTLIHGAGLVRNIQQARQLFDEMPKRNLKPDIGAYNAMISSLIRCRDLNAAMELMDEMEEKRIGHDNVTYHTMFFGLMKSSGLEGVCKLYDRMIEGKFVPKTRTVVMLMKFFCVNCRVDLGLNLWGYLIDRGFCPHGHALDLLVTGLCSRGRWEEAFECSKQMLVRRRQVSEASYRMLQRYLVQANANEKLEDLDRMIKNLQAVLPPPTRQQVAQ
ncbi:hypothetical protein AB3S75_024037 [Citrus x aurantiifolia]